jgi:hypothetical protein
LLHLILGVLVRKALLTKFSADLTPDRWLAKHWFNPTKSEMASIGTKKAAFLAAIQAMMSEPQVPQALLQQLLLPRTVLIETSSVSRRTTSLSWGEAINTRQRKQTPGLGQNTQALTCANLAAGLPKKPPSTGPPT